MSDPLPTIEDMDEYSGAMGSDGDVAVLVSIVGEVESAAAAVTAGQVAEVRALARAGQLAERQAAGAPARVRAHDMALRAVAAELGGVLRVTDRTVQVRIDEARTIVEDYSSALTAWEAGRITRAHVRVIVDAGTVVPSGLRAGFEVEAVRLCEGDTPNRVRAAVETLAERMADRSFTDRHRDAAANRCVRVVPGRDGMSDVVATVPTVIADGILDRLTQQAQTVIDARTSDDRNAIGDGGSDVRRIDQVRADILTDLLLTGVPSLDPTAAGDAPGVLGMIRAQVQVIVPVLTLLGADDGPADLVGRSPVDADGAVSRGARAVVDTGAHRPDRWHGRHGRPVSHGVAAATVPACAGPALPVPGVSACGNPLRDRPHHRRRPRRTHHPQQPRPPVPETPLDETVHKMAGQATPARRSRMDLTHRPHLPRRRPRATRRVHPGIRRARRERTLLTTS